VKTVTLDVRDPADAVGGFVRVWKAGKPERSARISLASPDLLWKVLTAKRWELLKALCGAGPVSIRGAARRVGRDVKAVHAEITGLSVRGGESRVRAAGRIVAKRPDPSASRT
jgi:predicted transcriptional regulator